MEYRSWFLKMCSGITQERRRRKHKIGNRIIVTYQDCKSFIGHWVQEDEQIQVGIPAWLFSASIRQYLFSQINWNGQGKQSLDKEFLLNLSDNTECTEPIYKVCSQINK